MSTDKTVVTRELTLNPVTTEDSGKYTCVAKNRQKFDESYISLTVNGKNDFTIIYDNPFMIMQEWIQGFSIGRGGWEFQTFLFA